MSHFVFLSRCRRAAGFTIIEVLIALGLTVLVGLFATQLLTSSMKAINKAAANMESKIDEKLGERYLLKDFRISAPSMNTISISDDNRRNFYDFDSDKSSPFYKSQTSPSRTVTLQRNGRTALYFLIYDEKNGKSLFTDAITFFELGVTPTSMDLPTPLIYQGLNHKNYLTINGPGYLSDSTLLLVDSSAFMAAANGNKQAVFIGRPKTTAGVTDLVKIEFPDSIFNYTIVNSDQTNTVPNNFEEYLINLPAVGANGASVRLKAVRLIKYQLDCTTIECDLNRYDFSSLRLEVDRKTMIIKGIEKVKFHREDIATTVFKVEVIGKSK